MRLAAVTLGVLAVLSGVAFLVTFVASSMKAQFRMEKIEELRKATEQVMEEEPVDRQVAVRRVVHMVEVKPEALAQAREMLRITEAEMRLELEESDLAPDEKGARLAQINRWRRMVDSVVNALSWSN